MTDTSKKLGSISAYVFMRIFEEKDNEDILISLTNAILSDKIIIKKIKKIYSIYEDVLPKNYLRGCRLSILATTNNGDNVYIEIKYRNSKVDDVKAISNFERIYVDKNINYVDLYFVKKIISIRIYDKDICERISPINNCFFTSEPNKTDEDVIVWDDLQFTYLELNKYKRTEIKFGDELTKWVDFLINPNDLDKNTKEDKDIEKALKTLDSIISNTEEKLII